MGVIRVLIVGEVHRQTAGTNLTRRRKVVEKTSQLAEAKAARRKRGLAGIAERKAICRRTAEGPRRPLQLRKKKPLKWTREASLLTTMVVMRLCSRTLESQRTISSFANSRKGLRRSKKLLRPFRRKAKLFG